MVPVCCDTELYTNQGVLDHLGNNTTYRQITENIAKSSMVKIKYSYGSFITRNRLELSDAEWTYLWRSLKNVTSKYYVFISLQISQYPCTTRPVVSTSGTMMAGLRKWLDHWLQKLCHQVPTYLKDSIHLIQLLTDQVTLPPGAKLFTADSKSMYTNIDTNHGTIQVEEWIEKYHK